MRRCSLLLIAFALCACQTDRPVSQPLDLGAYWSAFRQSLTRHIEPHPQPRETHPTPKWVREDHAVRTWVACVRGRGHKLALTSHAEPDAVADTAMKGCHTQEAAYAKSLKAMGIGGIGTDVRDDLGKKVSLEITEERARNRGQLRAELDKDEAVTSTPLPPSP